MISHTNNDTGIDLEALRKKYREEREKRLRPEGDHQYVEARGEFAHFAEDDPYADPNFKRDPITKEFEVVIVGGGFAGLFCAARLHKSNIDDICIIEAGADFGGTWYWNRYPGCRCDIESYTYVPLLEETGFMPSERYVEAAEIYEQCRNIGKHFDLYDDALFQTRVRELRWDEDKMRWNVTTNRGDKISAQYVITATGPLSKPKLPGIPGMETFKGKTFHTARWDYNYTGGDSKGGMHNLADKKVAIIGSASTGVQAAPFLAEDSKHLYVFQRTPVAVFPRNNKPTDPEWVKSLKPGWQQERVINFNQVVTGQKPKVDMVDDCWTEIYKEVPGAPVPGTGKKAEDVAAEAEKMAIAAEIKDAKKMNMVRNRVDSIVKDKELAEKLKPWFRLFCKRPTFHDGYLDIFNRDNVTLVDVSESKGVERITEKGLVANGIEYEVDCIVYATGYEISTGYERRVDYDTYGIGGESLMDHWKDGRKTLHGHSTHGFPNQFTCGVSQNGLSMNFSSMYGGQSDHIAYIIEQVKKRGAKAVMPTTEAENKWVETIYSLSRNNAAFLAECTPGYFNNDGKFDERTSGFLNDAYAPGIIAFNQLMADWREQGDCEGLEFL
jgi:cyclohexanone monooxygenase